MQISTCNRAFLLSSAVIFAGTGVAKLLSTSADSRLLQMADPIVGIQVRYLLLAAGVIEVVVALVCLRARRPIFAATLVAWISTSFVVYRIGLWWMDWKQPCGCLGNLTDILHLTPQTADNIVKVVLAYLLVGSCTLLFLNSRRACAAQFTTAINCDKAYDPDEARAQ